MTQVATLPEILGMVTDEKTRSLNYTDIVPIGFEHDEKGLFRIHYVYLRKKMYHLQNYWPKDLRNYQCHEPVPLVYGYYERR